MMHFPVLCQKKLCQNRRNQVFSTYRQDKNMLINIISNNLFAFLRHHLLLLLLLLLISFSPLLQIKKPRIATYDDTVS